MQGNLRCHFIEGIIYKNQRYFHKKPIFVLASLSMIRRNQEREYILPKKSLKASRKTLRKKSAGVQLWGQNIYEFAEYHLFAITINIL